MAEKGKNVIVAGRKGKKVSKANSFSGTQNKQKHERKPVKVYDRKTGKTTQLQKEGSTYYRKGQMVQLTKDQKEVGASMKKYGASGYVSAAQRKAVHASKAEQKAKKGASMKKYGASKKEFPEIKEKNQGKFTKWVEKNMPGMDTCKAASKIMRSKTKKYSPSVVKMANYANNFGCKAKKDGSSMDHGKKGGASFNPKLRKAVADGKIKGKFADAVMKGSKK